jgi:uncharacterized protein (DUF58 family)
VHNKGWLPVLWLRLRDTMPADLTGGATIQRVISLLPREHTNVSYAIVGRRRGYHKVGPLTARSGDLLGTATFDQRVEETRSIIVYPLILPLRDLGFPSQSPFGTLPARNPIFEDPTRVQGVRDYQTGDPLKRLDWKTSARAGSLKVRRHEPAISMGTALFLNLNLDDYSGRERFTAPELGIVAAASLATHITDKRQAISLVTNGHDPHSLDAEEETASSDSPTTSQDAGSTPMLSGASPAARSPGLPLRKGRAHLMSILDLLARVEAAREGQATPFLELLHRRSLPLPWGTTVVVITSREAPGLMDTLLTLRRRGLVVILCLTLPHRALQQTVHRARQIGVQAIRIWHQQDMDIWR